MAPSAGTYVLDRYVIDTLMRDLVGHDRRPAAFMVYLSLTASHAEGRAALSHAQLAERTGLSKRAVQDAIAHLRRRALIAAARASATDIATYQPLTPWRRPAG
jgi:CRP-like cAMP-binding protein